MPINIDTVTGEVKYEEEKEPENGNVNFLATIDRRTQDRDGEWKITLLVPLSEDAYLVGLSEMLDQVVKVTIAPTAEAE